MRKFNQQTSHTKMIQTLELSDKGFKEATIKMLQHYKHKWKKKRKKESFRKEKEDTKNQMEILELWNIIIEMKNSLDGVNNRMEKEKEKKISDLEDRICIT